MREELKEIFRELGKTYGERSTSRTTPPTPGGSSSRSVPDFEAMDALEAIYRAEEKWTDVIDVKMQRADALGEPAERIEELRSIAALWRDQVGDPDGARAAYEKILEIDPTHDEAFSELEKLHTTAGTLGAAGRALARAARDAGGDQREDRAPAQDRARLRGEARRQEPGARRAGQRARRSTSTTARPPATWSAWRRRPAAGPRSSRPSTDG